MSKRRPLRLILAGLTVSLFVGALVMLVSGGRSAWSEALSDSGVVALLGGGGPVGGVSSRPVTISGSGHVQMTVVDLDGNPLTEGTVVLSCLQGGDVLRIEEGAVRIEEEGHVVGPGCRGQVCAELMHASHVPAEPWVVRPGVETTVVARPLMRLHGQVFDDRGHPVPAATVYFVAPPEADPMAVPPLVTRSTTTDADGAFSAAGIERPPCGPCEQARGECEGRPLPVHDQVMVVVRADGLAPGEVLVDAPGLDGRVVGSTLEDPITITLAPSEGLTSGRLTDEAGRAYPRAYVLARSTTRPYEQHRAEVIEDVFELDGLGEGRYDLRALQDGVELAVRKDVGAGDEVELVGEPRADGPDVVLVLHIDGGPAEGFVVDGGPFRGAETDMQGEVRARQALPGPVRVRVRGPGRRPTVHEVVIDDPAEAEGEEQIVRIELPSARDASRG